MRLRDLIIPVPLVKGRLNTTNNHSAADRRPIYSMIRFLPARDTAEGIN